MLDLRYPIGKYTPPETVTSDHLEIWKDDIMTLHEKLSTLLHDINILDYTNKYRKGGWNISQLLYHLTDSHINSIIRYKWALTEDAPLIKAYDENAWAQTKEVINSNPLQTLKEIDIIQSRLFRIVDSLDKTDLERAFIHPETNRKISLAVQTGLYAWHGNHHLEHIRIALASPAVDYVPIDCNFYDILVLAAMRKSPLALKKNEDIVATDIIIEDLITDNKEEFIFLSDGQKLRLDQVIDLKDNTLYLKK